MDRLTVIVTGVGGGGHGEQIFKALRLAATPYEIIACDKSQESKGFTEADYSYVVPAAEHPEYIPSLVRIANKHRARALFHGSEPELKAMSRHRLELQAAGLFLPINPDSVIRTCMDKALTCAFLEQHGFEVPRWRLVREESDLEEFPTLPAVLKPSVGGGGSAHVFLAQRTEELRCFGRYLLAVVGEFIVQEYVGTPDSEFTVGVLLDMEGTVVNSIAVRRNILSSLSNRIRVPNRTERRELGPILAISSGVSQGEVGRFPEVTDVAERIATALGSRGVLNVQCRLVEGRPYVMEINPRFSGTTSLRAMVGYNEPDVLIRTHVLGESIERRFAYGSGIIVRGLSETLLPYPKAT